MKLDKGSPPRIVALAIVVVLGVAGSVALWRMVVSLERAVAAEAFRRDAEERALAVGGKLDIALETLETLAELFRANEDVTRSQFVAAAGRIRCRHTYIKGFGWNARVPARLRGAFERQARSDYPGYQITERLDGEMVRARERPEYVAVRFLEPMAKNEEALGYDIASEKKRGTALARSRHTRQPTATAPIDLVQDDPDQPPGFLACVPVGDAGYVVGVYRAHDIVTGALANFEDVGLVITLSDDGRNLYETAAEPATASDLVHKRTVDRAGRNWRLEMRPTEAYLAAHRSWAPLVSLAVGLLFTALLAAYLTVLTGRSARIAALVSARTRELTNEVVQRQRAEHELTRHRDSLEDTVRERTEDLTVALARLQETEERQRLTLEAIADGAWDWNVATGECRYSARWLTSLGYEPGEVQPHVDFWTKIVHPQDLAAARTALTEHFEERTPHYEFTSRVLTKSGQWRWNLGRGRVVARNAAGEPLRMVGTNTDITDRVRADEQRRTMEQKIQHAQKLESLGVLAGGIAHDFNNLLVAMVGGADIALRTTPPEEAAHTPLQHIKSAALRASELVDQMLAYAGRNTMNRELVHLPAVVDEMAQLLDASTSKLAELRFEVEAGVPPVTGDPTQLRQVAMNLITNASDAVGDGPGSVTVRIRTVTVGRRDLAAMLLGADLVPGDYVSLEVVDTGAGMEADTVEKIFDPFFTTKFQGRGLGLAAVLGIVRGHGGAVRVKSEPGQGTAFRILFPCAAEPAAMPEPRPRRATNTVLVVDDEAIVRDIATEALEGAGYRVVQAADGPEGLAALRAHADEIDVVVLDMTMPRMTGTETLHALRRIRPDVPVLFSSGYSEVEVGRAVADLGAAGFVKKPYRVDTLVETVRDTISRRP